MYTTSQVARITGVSLRQLQWWDERKLVVPPIVSHARQYGPQELFAVALIRDLRERGFTLQQIRRVYRRVESKGISACDGSYRWMLTDGTRVEFIADPDVVLNFLEQRRNPACVLVPLVKLAARLAADATRCLAVAPLRRGPGQAMALRLDQREAKRA